MATIIIVTLICSAPGQAPTDSVRPEVREAWLAQAGAATLGGGLAWAAAFGIGDAIASDGDWFGGAVAAGLSALLLVPLASGAGTSVVGELCHQDGGFWAASAGGFAGMAVGLGATAVVVRLADESRTGALVGLCASSVLAVVGATLAYNSSRSPANKAHAWLDRVSPPKFGIRPAIDEEGTIHAGLDCRLVTVRF